MWTICITKEKHELKKLSDVKWPLERFCNCLCMWIILHKLTEVRREYAQEKLLTWMFVWRIRLLLRIFLPRSLKEHYVLYVYLSTCLLPLKNLWILCNKPGTYTWGCTMKPLQLCMAHKIKTFEQNITFFYARCKAAHGRKCQDRLRIWNWELTPV